MNHLYTSEQIEKDIWDWLIHYIEVPNKFYNFKFAPCPFAKSARLKNLVDIKVYNQGNFLKFIKDNSVNLILESSLNTRIMVFPPYFKYLFFIKWYLFYLNTKFIKQNYYIQFGNAVTTKSKYNSFFKNQPYRIIIINKLSDVLDAKKILEKTSYYDNWNKKHYKSVVLRRDKFFRKYKNNL
jgi:hypothetical protein